MITRGKDEDDTICHDAHTMALRRANRTHEFNTIIAFARSSGIFLACQRFCHRSRSCCRSLRNSTDGHTMASDALTNGPMYIRSDPNLNIFIIVCPSGVKFGTVWRLHNKSAYWSHFTHPLDDLTFRKQRLRWIGGGLECFSRYYNITHISLRSCMHCMYWHGLLEGTRAWRYN